MDTCFLSNNNDLNLARPVFSYYDAPSVSKFQFGVKIRKVTAKLENVTAEFANVHAKFEMWLKTSKSYSKICKCDYTICNVSTKF